MLGGGKAEGVGLREGGGEVSKAFLSGGGENGYRPAGVGPRLGGAAEGVGPRDGGKGKFGSGDEAAASRSAPDQRKPSKRPEMRISHSAVLMSERVVRRW